MKRMFLSSWTIGTDCYDKVYELVCGSGTKAAVIGGKTAMSKAYPPLEEALKGTDIALTEPIWYGGEASYENVDMLIDMPQVRDADMIFAVGGGRALDTGKCAADKLNKPVYTFPTLSSNCAPSTAISIMYYPDGSARENCYLRRCPEHTFINSNIIADSPADYFWAGIGDALSKEYETEFTSRVPRRLKEVTHIPLLGIQIAPCITETLLNNGEKAYAQVRAKTPGLEMEEVAQSVIITTGLCSNLTAGGLQDPPYYYNSSLAHAFYYGSTICKGAEKHLHGEVVALGLLVMLTFDHQTETRDRLMEFYQSLALPICMDDIELDMADIDKLIDKASTFIEWGIPPCTVPYTIEREAFKQAIIDTDTAGRGLKGR